MKSMHQWLFALLCPLLLSCGGGGGGSSDNNVQIQLAMPAQSDSATIERVPLTIQLQASVAGLKPGQLVYGLARLGGEDHRGFATDVRMFSNVVETIVLDIDIRTDLPAGEYVDELQFALCSDSQCRTLLAGPTSTRIHVLVKPNIGVAPLIELKRTGAEPAPTLDVALQVPPEALPIEVVGADWASLVDGKLRIVTMQDRAGVYEAPVHIRSLNTTAYWAITMVRYVVTAPEGGEVGMTVTPNSVDLLMKPGQQLTRRISVKKATWSSAPVSIEATTSDLPIFSVSRLSEDEFELTVDSRGLAAGVYYGNLIVKGSAMVNDIFVPLVAQVDALFTVAQPPMVELSASSTVDDTRWSSPVQMADGSTATWSAQVSAPWLRLPRASGTTGTHALELEVVRELLPDYPGYQYATVDVSLDRPGVPPLRLFYSMRNIAQAITSSSPGALVGTSGRIYLSGLMLNRDDLVTSGMLTVQGATLRNVSYHADPRFVGSVFMVVLDVDGATPGSAVTVNLRTPLLNTSAQYPVVAAATVPAALAPLSFAHHRPGAWSARENAWYFARNGRVFRYALASAQWTLQSVDATGVIDVDLAPDESVLLATSSEGKLAGLDPRTLATRWQATLASGPSLGTLDARGGSVLHKALAHTADGHLFVAVRSADTLSAGVATLAFDWRRPTAGFDWNTGIGYQIGAWDTENTPYGIASSSGRELSLLSMGSGADSRHAYNALQRSMTPGYADPMLSRIPSGPAPTSGADNGQRVLTANGTLHASFGSAWLGSGLAAGRTALGYALTRDGQFGLVHSVKFAGTAGAEVATEPEIAVIDLRASIAPGQAFAILPMNAPVGCVLPRASDEPCLHQASLVVDSASRMVFVQGPRGAAIVPLPATMRQGLANPPSRALQRPYRWAAAIQARSSTR